MRDIVRKAQEMETHGKRLALYLSPKFDYLPIEAQRFDEPLLPYSRLILEGAGDYLAVVAFDLAAYMRFGGAGAVALERSIRLFSDRAVTVLDGPFSDASFASLLDDLSFSPDAITVVGTEWDLLQPNPRLIATANHGLRREEGGQLTIGTSAFRWAGTSMLENARSVDFRASLAEAVARFTQQ